MKKILLGIIVSSLFIYLSVRGVDVREALGGLADARYPFIFLAIVLLLLVSALRSIRWGVLLSPMERIEQKRLYPIVCVGYFAIILVPMRLGELVRPWLVANRSQIPISSALATVLVERILDILTLLCILLWVVFNADLPQWVVMTGYGILPVFGILILSVCFLYFKTDMATMLLNRALKKCPQKYRTRIENLLASFIDGFQIVGNPGRFFYAVLLSLLIWGLSGYAIYTLFHFQNLDLPVVGAFVVLIVTILGISLPTAPGMVGNFQMGCIVALAFFKVQKSDAFLFSMVNYFTGIGLNVLLGLVFLPVINISLNEIRRSASEFFRR